MKRKFTFILTGLMLLAVGVNAEPVSLKTNGGQNVWCESKDGYLTLHFIVATDNHGAFQYDVDVESYKHVQLVNTGTSGAKLEVDV